MAFVEESELVGRKVVAISGASSQGCYDRLFEVLGQLYPVAFRRAGLEDDTDADGLIVLSGDVLAGCAAADRGIPSYVVVDGAGDAVNVSDTEVLLGKSTLLDETLRGQAVDDNDVSAFCPLVVLPGDMVLASKGGHAIWVARAAARGECQLTALAPPVLHENEYLVQHFHGLRYLRLLPLMNFLRQLTRDADWQAPTQHACLVLDDPSLYWPTYGFVDFRLLAEHAREHDYSVSVATIPLDSWWVNPSVAAIFRSERPRLSLIVHGNDHTWQEMVRSGNGAGSFKAAAQALRRITRLDRKHGIRVARIMESPHGTCNSRMFPHLLSLGYEGALATFELLVRSDRSCAWPATIGLESFAVAAGGLPIIPRIRAHPSWKNDVVLAAFLRQPIAVAVHHQDAAQEMAPLAEIARTVNSVGNIVWSDLPGTLRTSYVQKIAGDVLHVRMYSSAVTVRMPDGARRICVHRPWIAEGHTERIRIRLVHGSEIEEDVGAVSRPVSLLESEVVEVRSEARAPLDLSSVAPSGVHLWPIARKAMMELRDRVTPVLSRFGFGWESTRTAQR